MCWKGRFHAGEAGGKNSWCWLCNWRKILVPCTLGMANPVTRKFHPSFGIIHLKTEPTFTISLDNKLSYVEFTDCCSLM